MTAAIPELTSEDASTVIAIADRAVTAASVGIPTEAAIHRAQLLLLDAIACAIAGAREPIVQTVARVARAASRKPDCVLIADSARTDVLNATLVNGVAIRALDLNDYLVVRAQGEPETGGHPSDIIPVALALGAARRRSGREILAAIVVGYELYARTQRLMDRQGLWDSAVASGIAAPVVAGLLMGLDRDRLAHALALSAARSATPAIVRRGTGSSAKALASALVAQAAVQAALLAEQGLTGPLAILDDARGLGHLFPRGDAFAVLGAAWPEKGAVFEARIKAFACVNTAQAAIAAALQLHKHVAGRTDGIRRIDAIMADYPVIRRHQEDPARLRPTTREAADHSIPFLIAVALIDGTFGPKQLEHERWRDPFVRAVMEKIALKRDPALNTHAAAAYPCTLKLWDENGQERQVEVVSPPGFSLGGLADAEVIAKFHAVTSDAISRRKREAIVDRVLEFHAAKSTTALDIAIAKKRANA